MATKSMSKILKTQFAKKIPTGVGRITNQGVMSRRDRFLRIFGGLKTESGATNAKFESVTEDDLLNLPIVDLVLKMVKSDTLLDMTVDLYCTLVSLEHTITSEQDRTQRGIDEINQMLTDKKIPLSLLVSHIVSSMILRGNVCVERVFDENGRPSSAFCIDTRWFEWRLHDVPIDGQMWFLGQFTGEQNTWERLAETPNVLWLSVNPLVGERTGRSPLASAFDPLIKDTRMLDDLSEVISTQAFIRRYIQFKVIEMKNAGYSDSKIAELVKEAQEDMQAWSNLKPDEIPTSTDAIDWNSEPGVSQGSGMGFVDTVDRVYDRKSIRGAKIPPFAAGSNEFVAESSANTQAQFYSTTLGTAQENLAFIVEWVYRGFLRSMGLRGDPIFSTKRVNTVERLNEARAFDAVMKALLVATKAGLSLPVAVEMYEAESGAKFPADIKAKIAEDWQRRMDEASTVGTGVSAGNLTANRRGARAVLAKKKDVTCQAGTCECCDPNTNFVAFATNDAGKFEPTDADEALPEIPALDTLTNEMATAALALWNEALPDYENLIAASLEDIDEGDWAFEDINAGEWQYYNEDEYYIINAGTDNEVRIDGDELYLLRDTLVEHQQLDAMETAQELVRDESTLRTFMQVSAEALVVSHLASFALGRGGLNAITVADVGIIVADVLTQYDFFQNFAEAIREGALSPAEIVNRAGMYGESATIEMDKGRAASKALELPAFPCDGSMDCKSRCRCHWKIVETDTAWECTWTLQGGSPDGKNCQTCLEYADRWKPFIVEK